MGAPLFACTGDCDLAHWSELIGTVAVDASVVVEGRKRSVKVVCAGDSSQAKYDFASAQQIVVARLRLRLPSDPAADALLLSFRSAASNNMQIGWDAASGKFCAWGELAWAGRVLSSAKMVAGAWHVFDLYHDRTASPDLLRWRIDEVTQSNVSGNNTGGATVTDSFILGARNADDIAYTTYTCHYADLTVSATSGDYPMPDYAVRANPAAEAALLGVPGVHGAAGHFMP